MDRLTEKICITFTTFICINYVINFCVLIFQSENMTVNGCKTKQDSSKVDVMLTTEMTTFGVDLDEHLLKMGTRVPTVVTKCVEAIEEHGILVKVS